MGAAYRLISLMTSEEQLPVNDLINRSEILSDFPLEETPVLINAIAAIKSNASNSVLEKIKEAMTTYD